MAEARRSRLLLSPMPHAELVAAQAVEEIAAGLSFPRDTLDEVKLAVVEACLNALEYGGGKVEVELTAHVGDRARIEVAVIDHGPGFDPESVARPQLGEKLHNLRKRGWGLELIRRLMDRVEILSRQGRTEIRMVRSRDEV